MSVLGDNDRPRRDPEPGRASVQQLCRERFVGLPGYLDPLAGDLVAHACRRVPGFDHGTSTCYSSN